MNSGEIRETFLRYFENKGHSRVPSSPVVPNDDPTLLFANAGMNQFKDIFLGHKESKFKRATSTQKCIRVSGKHNDLEEVGRDGTHHTFFEMLGNWSFGDYFKEEAIFYAWELLTKEYALDKSRLWATVYKDDDEAFKLWKKISGLPESRIIRCGEKDNFWEMGETGPCGPCSEIHYDTKPGAGGVPNDETEQFVEIWNLVFMEFFRDGNGKLSKLPMQSVDTGLGYERLCSILQDCIGINYHTSLFMPIIREIEAISGVEYNYDKNHVPFWVIADHIRALTYAISDGALPSNEGRGYVMRRILRRAARFSRELGMHEPILYKLSSKLIDISSDVFPELLDRGQFVATVIKAEEDRFEETLDNGLKYFEKITESLAEGDTISGDSVFKLYDTFGFPIDLTALLSREKNLNIDDEGFNEELEKQRERARGAGAFKAEMTLGSDKEWIALSDGDCSAFIGYDKLDDKVEIRKWRQLDDDKVAVILDKTPFYAESGGQIGDIGELIGEGFKIDVINTIKEGDDIMHIGKIAGEIQSPTVNACVLGDRRLNIARNHTATHLLHAALRKVIGDHARQSGSLVEQDRLRFDYTHFKKPSEQELMQAERLVNEAIIENYLVNTRSEDYKEALRGGVTALFGEKYTDEVRVVSVDPISAELCGGTHVERTGNIGSFVIVSEESVGAGIRRIEALTGETAVRYIQQMREIISQSEMLLKVKGHLIPPKIKELQEEVKNLSNQIKSREKEKGLKAAGDLLDEVKEINGVKAIISEIEISDRAGLGEAADMLKERLGGGVIALIAKDNDKVAITISVSKDLVEKGINAGKMIREMAIKVGGGGGGRPDFASAGGKDIEKIEEAIQAGIAYIKDVKGL